MQIRTKKGMLSLEYAILIAILVAALLGMAVYIKRAISGKFRESGDVFGYGRQYVP
jgi:Flp pilus assembly pilin Flp